MEVHEIFTSTLPRIVSLALHESNDSSFHDLSLPRSPNAPLQFAALMKRNRDSGICQNWNELQDHALSVQLFCLVQDAGHVSCEQ